MEHPFFVKTEKQQNMIQLKILAWAILFNIILGSLFVLIGAGLLIFVCLSITISIIAPFIDVPSGVKSGSLNYYSPLLIGEAVKNDILKLHAGTLFDYYYVLSKNASHSERKKQAFKGYIEGLLNLIEQYEPTRPNPIKIKATSYIINPRTAEKIGLSKVKTNFLGRSLLYFNYVNLLCSLSLMNGKLSFPKLNKVSSFEGELDQLIGKKDYLLALNKRL
ncbi:hypothetical protein [uncultured Paraglaciecola sp.]|uniref:hypothetical protein n=1 Tax=uncultured Paraglaciecola sp. TaxID=1765024 RepID=UPI0025D9AEAC|nr:hypothetical protein [uncultured Paraglaciecola sp.]